MTGSQQDTTSCLSHADQVASRRSTQNTVLAYQELLDTIGGANLGNLGDNLGVVKATITTNDQERVLHTLRD